MYSPYLTKRTSRRVPKRPFWFGFGSVLNIAPRHRTDHTTDAEALQSDWQEIGRDITRAMRQSLKI